MKNTRVKQRYHENRRGGSKKLNTFASILSKLNVSLPLNEKVNEQGSAWMGETLGG